MKIKKQRTIKLQLLWSMILLFSLNVNTQNLIENGDFEETNDCENTQGCTTYDFFSGCMGERWHNANQYAEVFENNCIPLGTPTEDGEHFLELNAGAQSNLLRTGDAIFYDIKMLKGQLYELNFKGIAVTDALSFLEFYAVKDIEEKGGTALNLWALSYVELHEYAGEIINKDVWSEYSVVLDLRNDSNIEEEIAYNHLLIIANKVASGTGSATVYLDAFSLASCSVFVEAPLEVFVDDSEDNCGSVDFLLEGDFEHITSYVWDFGDSSPLVKTIIPEVNHIYLSAGIYQATVTLIDVDGCIDVKQTEIDLDCDRCTGIEAAFESEYTHTQITKEIDEEGNVIDIHYRCQYTFTDLSLPSTGNTVVSWNWDFGDGYNSIEQNLTHNFDVGATYQVCLTIQDDHQCVMEYCQEVAAFCSHASPDTPLDRLREVEYVVSVFPNPAQEKISIQFSERRDKNTALLLLNAHGQEVRIIDLPGETTAIEINISNLQAGIYHLIWNDKNGNKEVHRVVVID